jgi:hypothetical protein
MVMETEGSTSSDRNAGTECKHSVTSRREERAELVRGTEKWTGEGASSTVLHKKTGHKKFFAGIQA